MKFFLMIFSMIVLRCCWGPSDFQLMLEKQNNNSILKEVNETYHIDTLNNEDVTSYNLDITFNNNTKQVSGFSGCNRFSGSYTLKNNALNIGALSISRMFCENDKNTIENKLLKAFGKANLILFTENSFSIYNKRKLLLSAYKETLSPSSIEYTASSRNSYLHIIVNKKTISNINKKGTIGSNKDCDAAQWDRIIKTLRSVEVKNISKLTPPSKDFQFDGAAIAQLKITYKSRTYETPSFDHGNPPEEIAQLVKEILSISENIE